MVKNEAPRIVRTMLTVSEYVDGFIVLDTGSEDDTVQVITDFCQANSKLLELQTAEFTDYSTTRNILLRHCAGKSNYVLLLDANDEVKNISELLFFLKEKSPKKKLINNRFEVYNNFSTRGQGYSYPRACCVKNDLDLGTTEGVHYIYPTHEMLIIGDNTSHREDDADYTLLNSSYYFFQDRSKDKPSKDRVQSDLDILIKYYNNLQQKELRPCYYICQSASDLGNFDILYKYGLELINFKDQEHYSDYVFYGYIFVGSALYKLKKTRYCSGYFLKAYEYSKRYVERCEPIYYLALLYYCEGMIDLARKTIQEACKIPKPPNSSLGYCVIQTNIYDNDRWELSRKLGMF